MWVATQLTQPSLYQFLQSAGVRDLKPESFYGLALALGGGEVTMEELAGLYAMLANEGMLQPLRVEASSPTQDRGCPAAQSRGQLHHARHAAAAIRGPMTTGMVPSRARWPVAWKTGTSWGFRDAWSAGVVGPYVLVVWIGNFDGRGESGVRRRRCGRAAVLPHRRCAESGAAGGDACRRSTPPPGVSRVAVCADSGDLPNARLSAAP